MFFKFNYNACFPDEANIKFERIGNDLVWTITEETKKWYKELKGLKKFHYKSFNKYIEETIKEYKEADKKLEKFLSNVVDYGWETAKQMKKEESEN